MLELIREADVKRAIEPVAMTRAAAARYLGFEGPRSLEERDDIPYIDYRPPGSKRPMVYYLKADLDAWLATRPRHGHLRAGTR